MQEKKEEGLKAVSYTHLKEDCTYNAKTLRMIGQMHKAISVIQFKLEAEIIRRRPAKEEGTEIII